MFEAGFTYILSKSLMNTRTKKDIVNDGVFFSVTTELDHWKGNAW